MKIKKAKEEKTSFAGYNEELKQLRNARVRNEKALKKATRENTLYNRAVKPYVYAKKCLEKYEDYKNYAKI